MKGQHKLKLAIINVLSNPDVELIDASVDNIKDLPNVFESYTYTQGIATGTSTYTITVYNPKNDSRIPTKE